MSALDEAVRFAEEYGYNRWQEARDEAATMRRVIEGVGNDLFLLHVDAANRDDVLTNITTRIENFEGSREATQPTEGAEKREGGRV